MHSPSIVRHVAHWPPEPRDLPAKVKTGYLLVIRKQVIYPTPNGLLRIQEGGGNIGKLTHIHTESRNMVVHMAF